MNLKIVYNQAFRCPVSQAMLNGIFMLKRTKGTISRYFEKLFFKKWTIGVCQTTTIHDIIRKREFDPEIKWLRRRSRREFYADPFPLSVSENSLSVFCEILKFKENYGKITLLTLSRDLRKFSDKLLLDTTSHLSYLSFIKKMAGSLFFRKQRNRVNFRVMNLSQLQEH